MLFGYFGATGTEKAESLNWTKTHQNWFRINQANISILDSPTSNQIMPGASCWVPKCVYTYLFVYFLKCVDWRKLCTRYCLLKSLKMFAVQIFHWEKTKRKTFMTSTPIISVCERLPTTLQGYSLYCCNPANAAPLWSTLITWDF